MRVLFIVPYPTGQAPSQRFRFEHYYAFLGNRGISFEVSPFIDLRTWRILYGRGNYLLKVFGILAGYIRRMRDIFFRAGRFDFVFVHREVAPFGPPLLSWWLTKVTRAKVIYDFDDAVWIPNYSESNSWTNHLKRFANARNLCQWAYKASCGNDYLREFAGELNPRAVLNPTVIDTDVYRREESSREKKPFVIGWTGSHSTMRYLEEVYGVIADLEKEFDIRFHVISDVPPERDLRSLRYIRWKRETEVDDLLEFDVGLMPLPDDPWAKGKCGFKALQYLSLGIPALVSPVGVNTRIVKDGVNGFHCASGDEWRKHLTRLISNPGSMDEMRKACRQTVEDGYSVNSNLDNFMTLFS